MHTSQIPLTTDIPQPSRKEAPRSEQGYMLLTVVMMLTLLVISLSIASPSVIKSIQRDRDLEAWHRGMQYRRAIQLYYRKFHAYPPNVDALVNTNQIKFLRKRYNDPITHKDDWKPVMFGQNKTPTAMGFFGQPLSGNASTIAGVGPSGGNGLAGNGMNGGSAFGGSSSFGSSSFGGSSFGSSGGAGGIFSSSDSGSNTAGGASGSAGNSGSGPNGSSGSSSGSSSGFGSGQTFGGAGIIGFSPGSDKQSILVYKKKNHYNEWEFTYDPLSDMQQMGGGNTGLMGQPASSTSSPVGSSAFGNGGFGGSNTGGFGSSGFSSGGFGSGGSSFGGGSSGGAPVNSPSMPPEGSAPQ